MKQGDIVIHKNGNLRLRVVSTDHYPVLRCEKVDSEPVQSHRGLFHPSVVCHVENLIQPII